VIVLQDESGLLQVNLSSYPSDFSITFNVSGSFLGFTKVAAQVIRVRAADLDIQVRLSPLPPILLPPILPPSLPTFSGLYWMSLCGTETLFLITSLLTDIFCLLSKIFVFWKFGIRSFSKIKNDQFCLVIASFFHIRLPASGGEGC
jgi:hypothetical protein